MVARETVRLAVQGCEQFYLADGIVSAFKEPSKGGRIEIMVSHFNAASGSIVTVFKQPCRARAQYVQSQRLAG